MVFVNFLGLIFSCKEAPLKKGAHILNISSSSYNMGRENLSVYSSCKAAVVNFTQALAKERSDLKINVITPSRTNTKMRLENFPKKENKYLLSTTTIAQESIKILKSDITGSILEIKN